MSIKSRRIAAGICLIFSPLMYYLGWIEFLNPEPFRADTFFRWLWLFTILIVGVFALTTYRNTIFGINCGTILGYSIGPMYLLKYAATPWLTYIFFAALFLSGCLTLWKEYFKKHRS